VKPDFNSVEVHSQLSFNRHPMDGALVGGGSLVREAKHHLASSARRWFRFSFCTPFSALHSSARNHAIRFSVFLKKGKKFC